MEGLESYLNPRHIRGVYRTARVHAIRPDDVEDIVSIILYHAYRQFHSFDPNASKFDQWFGFIRMGGIQQYKRLVEKTARDCPLSCETVQSAIRFHGSPDLSAEENRFARRAELYELLVYLTPRECDVLYLRFFEEMEREDIGRHLRITRERVRQIETRGLKRCLDRWWWLKHRSTEEYSYP